MKSSDGRAGAGGPVSKAGIIIAAVCLVSVVRVLMVRPPTIGHVPALSSMRLPNTRLKQSEQCERILLP